MKVKYVFFLMTLGLGLVSCSDDDPIGNEVSEGEAVASLDFNSTVQQNKQQKAQSNFTFTSGNISIDNLFFILTQDGEVLEVDVMQDSEELVSVNLLTGSTTPGIENFVVPTGEFDQVQVEMEMGDEVNRLEGYFSDSQGGEYPVRVEIPAGETISIQTDGNFAIAESESIEAEVTLNPASWASEVSMEILRHLETNDEGVIVINESMNSDYWAVILDVLEASSHVEVNR